MAKDRVLWGVRWQVLKWETPPVVSARQPWTADMLLHAGHAPDETLQGEGNLLLEEGIQLLEDLLIGAGGTAFSATNAHIGVGDSSVAEAEDQTGLQATTNKLYRPMDSGYPSRTAQTITFRATFGGAQANFAWNEWTIANGSSDSAVNLNRKVHAMGTKASGSVWTLSCEITVS